MGDLSIGKKEDEKEEEDEELSAAELSLMRKVIHKGLVDNKNTVEIERQNPHSPLYSGRNFNNFSVIEKLSVMFG